MESTKKIPACTIKTVRGYSAPLWMTVDGKEIVYPAKKNVVFRSLENFAECRMFSKHNYEVQTVSMDDTGNRAASIDMNGNLMVWNPTTFEIIASHEHAYPGKVFELIFEGGKSDVLYFVGDVKGVTIKAMDFIHKNKTIGEFTKLDRPVLTGVAKKEGTKSYFYAGGEDAVLARYSGYPLGFEKKVFETKDNKFISMARLSPDGTKFLVVAFDKSITLFDALTGDKIDEIAAAKGPGNHTMAICSVCWMGEDKFITGSLDKTVKIWSLSEKKVLNTLKTVPKPDVPNMICNAITNGKVLVALTLNGLINIWNLEGISDDKLPDAVYDGHSQSITKIIYLENKKKAITSAIDGKVLLWDLEKTSAETLRAYDKPINFITTSFDNNFLYLVDRNGNITCIDISSDESMKQDTFVIKAVGDVKAIIPSKKENTKLYVLLKYNFIVYDKDKEIKKEKLPFEATAMDVFEDGNEVAIGEIRMKVHALELDTLKEKASLAKFMSEISAVKYSPDGKYLAAGECQKTVEIFNVETKEEYCYYNEHTSKVMEIAWSPDSTKVASDGLDGSPVIFDIATKKKVKKYDRVDGDGHNSLCFAGPNEILCAGSNCLINSVTF